MNVDDNQQAQEGAAAAAATEGSVRATGSKRRNPNSKSGPKSTKKRKAGTNLRKSLTDSDIELNNAGLAFSPSVSSVERGSSKVTSQRMDGLCRQSTTPIVVDLTSAVSECPAVPATVPKNCTNRATIDDLLEEVLQEIFCRLPAIDLVHFCSVVCKRFNSIISEKSYLPWKKLYARYLRRHDEAVREVEVKICGEIVDAGRPLGAMELMRYMSTVKRLTDQETEEARKRLTGHRLYSVAAGTTKRLLHTQKEIGNGTLAENVDTGHSNLGALVAALVLLSEDVESISSIVQLLTAQPAFCKTMYWIEFFYCLLTLLQAYSHLGVLKDGRLHYQVKYAIYLFENDGKKPYQELANEVASKKQNRAVFGQSSLNSFVQRQDRQPTYEQARVIGYDLKPGDYVRIIAFAGTGKTTTLLEYCRHRPNKRFLVVFYNRDVSDDAGARFPRNAECRTIHSLAFRETGWQTAYKRGEISLDAIIGARLPQILKLDQYVRAALVRETLKNFFASDREDIASILVPETWEVRAKKSDNFVPLTIEHDLKVEIVKQAERYWELMKDRHNEKARMPHDGYLKLYQLSKPILRGYDALLIDEAQDCNPAALDVFRRQVHLPKILVGDGYQQIYGFRGAINALESVPSTKTFYLTRSFRFGPEIAYIANSWMRTILQEKNKFLVGTDKPSRLDGVIEGQLAIICRTNFTVFNECVIIAEREERPCLSVGTAQKPFDFATLEALYQLYLSEKSRENLPVRQSDHWCLKRFKTFEEAKAFAEKVNDWELMSSVNIVEKHKMQTRQRIQLVKSCLVAGQKQAKFVVTTAHKSKGLEFQTVRLADDFPDFDDPHVHIGADDKNLIYVAMTRAMNSLILSDVVYGMLGRRLGLLFHSPYFSAADEALACTSCRLRPPVDQAKFLHRKDLAVTARGGTVRKLQRVMICRLCVAKAAQGNGPPPHDDDDAFGGNGTAANEDIKACCMFYLPFLE